jgi:3',5'-cyclic AMP phosphodiesterase CpdA
MYSVGKYGADPDKNAIALALKEQLNDLFVEHGVDLVLQGHDHVYSYTYPIAKGNQPIKNAETDGDYYVNPEGVVYAMHGPAGNQDRAPYKVDSNIYKHTANGSVGSWAEITINDNKLSVNVIKYNNGSPEIAFSYGIIK